MDFTSLAADCNQCSKYGGYFVRVAGYNLSMCLPSLDLLAGPKLGVVEPFSPELCNPEAETTPAPESLKEPSFWSWVARVGKYFSLITIKNSQCHNHTFTTFSFQFFISVMILQIIWIPTAIGLVLFSNRRHIANIFRYCWRRWKRDNNRPCFPDLCCLAIGHMVHAILDLMSLMWWNIKTLCGSVCHRAGYYDLPRIDEHELPYHQQPRFLRRAAAGGPRRPRPVVQQPTRSSDRIRAIPPRIRNQPTRSSDRIRALPWRSYLESSDDSDFSESSL